MSEKMVPVSVIVPCYCCVATIERAVESVARQTARPAEVILVDDRSGDDTLAALRRLQQRYGADWIKIIEQEENDGPSVARNAGWDVSTERFVAFLDADDAWHPRKLEIQYDWMVEHQNTIMTGCRSVYLRPGQAAPVLPQRWKARRVNGRRLLFANQFSTRTVMVQRKVPYRFDPGKRHSEDYLLWLHIVLSGYEAWRLEIPLAYTFKLDFGADGLSGDLWKMEKGELDNFRRLYHSGLIALPSAWGLMVWSLLKHIRRLLFVRSRGW